MADAYPCNWPRLPERVILDEVPCAPGIFSILKSAVDRRRVAGRFLLTGAFKTRKAGRLGKALAERVAAGGYPAALARSGARRRGIWYRDYIETLVQRDVRGLRKLKDAAGTRFAAGVVLHDGEMSAGFGDGLYVVPIRVLWETG